jgi:chromosome segregation ATPase
MTMKNLTIMMCSCLLLVACASDNPREGGFFGGVAGINSGNYDKRVQERQDSLERLNAIKQELGEEQSRLTSEKQRKEARVAGLKKQLTQLYTETDELTRQLERKRAESSGEQKKVAQLQQDLAQLRQEIAAAEKQAEQGRPVAALEDERNRLEQEYRQLLDLYLELGQ